MGAFIKYRPGNQPGQFINMVADPLHHIQELATVNGEIYVFIPDGVEMPDQPDNIAATIETVEMTAELKEQIKINSSSYQAINRQVKKMIAARYSVEDELKLLRSVDKTTDEFTAYNDFVVNCIEWGQDQKRSLGLQRGE